MSGLVSTATSISLVRSPQAILIGSASGRWPARSRSAPGRRSRIAFEEVATLFARVEAECTRFDPASDLMRANAAGNRWTEVGEFCFAAIDSAHRAYLATSGRFDPRVLTSLRRLGYDRTFPGRDDQPLAGVIDSCRGIDADWRPQLDPDRRRVRIGPLPIDLGGIGKGLAVRWAAELLGSQATDFLIEAGGDCYLAGDGPAGPGWQVGIEDPDGGGAPVAVLGVREQAVATSSIRLRRWRSGATEVHHLIDPVTGRPADGDLASVTVLGADPAWAEVWSKTLFIAGAARIAGLAEQQALAAVWVGRDGWIGMSGPAAASVVWCRG